MTRTVYVCRCVLGGWGLGGCVCDVHTHLCICSTCSMVITKES